jgi:acetoin utilization deacetylase AcuC-like enzyme
MPIKVFYDARQSVANNPSLSPSAGKPALVVKEWKDRGYDFALGSVTPVTREHYYRVHERKHVDDILDCNKNNGFGNNSADVAAALPWTSGSLLSAALEALHSKTNTCSPTSGFHHAGYSASGGFCTFNGLALTAVHLHDVESINRIGILDIDHHYGNGTDDIISKLNLKYIHHYTFGGDNADNYEWNGDHRAQRWLSRLPSIVKSFKDCEIIIYQAGADPHVDDPLGGALTSAQMRERDRIVFSLAAEMKVPVVWNLAGGYQKPIQRVLSLHNATMEECLKVMASAPVVV